MTGSLNRVCLLALLSLSVRKSRFSAKRNNGAFRSVPSSGGAPALSEAAYTQ